MRSNPVIAGFRLSRKEKNLIDYWLGDYRKLNRKDLFPSSISPDLNFFEDIDEKGIEEMMDWNLPLIVLTGHDTRQSPDEFHRLLDFLFETGVAAQLSIPDPSSPILLPPVRFGASRESIFVLMKDRTLRKIFRQLAYFSGRKVRADLQSSEEIIYLLNEISTREEAPLLWPSILIMDLDHPKSEVVSVITVIRKITQEKKELKNRLRVVLTRDFARPGVPLTGIAPLVSPTVRRIFHPYEAVLALLEEWFFYHPDQKKQSGIKGMYFHTLEEILYSKQSRFPSKTPKNDFEDWLMPLHHINKGFPFIWLYQYIIDLEATGGAILAPRQTGVNQNNENS